MIIEHHGVKGMHWGIRNSSTSGKSAGGEEKNTSARNKKIAATVGIGLVVAATLFAGDRYLKTSGGANARKVGQLAAQGTLKRAGSTPSSVVKAPSAATLKRSADHQAFLKQFAQKQASINKAANIDLKSGYERGMTPLPLREYLPDWT